MTLLTAKAEDFEARYWFDQDSGNYYTCTVSSGKSSLEIPVGNLPVKPISQLNFQIKNAEGEWSTVYTRFFYPGRNAGINFLYSFDTNPDLHTTDPSGLSADVSGLHDGLHRIILYDANGNIPSLSGMFYKRTFATDKMVLRLTSTRDSIDIKIPVNDKKSFTGDIDVSALTAGIYPVSISLSNVSDGQMVAMVNKLTDIRPVGGDRITGIYYWLDDSVNNYVTIPVSDGIIPYSVSTDINMADLDVPTNDYNLNIKEDGATITPNFNVGVALMNNYGHRVDSVSYYTDNGKTTPLTAVTLRPGVQYDFGKVDTTTTLWAQFNVQTEDKIRFRPRWRSVAKFFDNSGVAIDTVKFDDEKPITTFTAGNSGVYYAELYEIDESIRDFSVLMSFLSGPSADNPDINKPYEYDGIPVEWDSSAEWSKTDGDLSLLKNGINVNVLKSTSDYTPSVGERTNLCRILKDNRLVFSSDGYIERITLCIPEGSVIPDVKATEGKIDIDTDRNILIWEGLSKVVELTVRRNFASDMADDTAIPEILMEKAYVKISEIDKSLYTANLEDKTDGYTYTPFNCMRVWQNGNKIGEYRLHEDLAVSFADSNLIVRSDGEENTYKLDSRLIITLSHEVYDEIEDIVSGKDPSIIIADGNIKVSGLPAFVGIYTIKGLTVFERYVDDSDFSYPVDNLMPGIYIVKVGESVTKLLIR